AGVRECEADGLMRGCIADQECVDGSCVPTGQPKPLCGSDLDCPFFQACLSGGCYSNCEDHVDCPPGLGCHQHVCRVPCESVSGGAGCEAGFHCDAPDGANGYCSPLAPPEPTEVPTMPEAAAFALDRSSVAFSNVETTASFHIQIA